MVEQKLKTIGTGNFFYIPTAYIKMHELNKYVYYQEVSEDGKTITHRRMRKLPKDEIDKINQEQKEKLQKSVNLLKQKK